MRKGQSMQATQTENRPYWDESAQQWAVRLVGQEGNPIVRHHSKSVVEDLLDWIDNKAFSNESGTTGTDC